MREKRKLKRRHLIYYLKVTDRQSGKLIGFLVNITPEGIMIMSEEPIPVGKLFHLQILVPSETDEKAHLQFDARSKWCERSVNTDFYDTGFELLNVTSRDFLAIEKIIAELGFED
ncbi:MAG: PilZ domain-containing protein [Desulfobacterota bacterium]|nr:PilZ domain-containing protein [Thermodesulfobacteriota bacterium]